MSIIDSLRNSINKTISNVKFCNICISSYAIPKDMTEEKVVYDTPDEETVRYESKTMYGFPEDRIIFDEPQTDYGIQVPEPTQEPTAEVKTYYGILTPEPEPTQEPTAEVKTYYGILTPKPEPTQEPTAEVKTYYGILIPEPEPTVTPQQTVTPQPTVKPQPQPMPVNQANPWQINVRNIFLNLFGGVNSSFAQRVMSVFDNFFSRWS